jgi:Holliday junction resolvasome RuvABC DNA-binding subunit
MWGSVDPAVLSTGSQAESKRRHLVTTAEERRAGREGPRHEWLIGAPNAVGYKPDDIAGALSAVSKKNLTIEETQDAVKAWLRAPVKEA